MPTLRLTQSQVYTIAILSGVPNPRVMAAIAMAESGGNVFAHNPNSSTGDDSYGLWQINMLGAMGPSRRKEFGIASNKELFNPFTNAKAAKKIYASQGLNAWSVYRSGAYQKHVGKAVRNEAGGTVQAGTSSQTGWLGDWWDDFKKGFEDGFDVGPGPEDFGDEDGFSDDKSESDILGLGGISDALKKSADMLVNPQMWLRFAYGITGAALIIGGLFMIVSNNSAVKSVTSAVPVKKVASMVKGGKK